MRTLASSVVSLILVLAWAGVGDAQLTDAERATARQLFKEGDELQRSGRFADALDKFQRAQETFGAPTNLLRIAECEAALGRLVESAEAYRAVARASLGPSAPAAFQAAVEQARAELGQVEPRVPRLIVQLQPPGVKVQLQIDGQNAPSALLGEAIPMDPGPHQIGASASGYRAIEMAVTLKERESRTATLTLRPLSTALGLPPSPAPAPPPPAAAPSAPPAPPPPAAAGPGDLYGNGALLPPRRHNSRLGLLIGGHLGAGVIGGTVPLDGQGVDASSISNTGVAYGLDAGFRFARHWVVGGTLEHANFGQGDLSGLMQPGTNLPATYARSATTLLDVTLAFIGNPDRVSFYGDVGLGERWYSFSATGLSRDCAGTELSFGGGVWIPTGASVRLLPEITLSVGTFPDTSAADAGGSTYWHSVLMAGLAGVYNLDF
ncbi:MAG: tetratricopeptide repeat protein [Polyangiaceae bacterium]|jgi:hypothetical protein